MTSYTEHNGIFYKFLKGGWFRKSVWHLSDGYNEEKYPANKYRIDQALADFNEKYYKRFEKKKVRYTPTVSTVTPRYTELPAKPVHKTATGKKVVKKSATKKSETKKPLKKKKTI